MDKLTDLASGALGGRVLFATDEWFAGAHLLLRPEAPVFLPDEFTEFGKWMDGWETRRKRIPGHDWCVVQLALRGTIEAIEIDTAFFTGNNAPRASVQAASFPEDLSDSKTPAALRQLAARATAERAMGVAASDEELELAEQLKSHEWTDLVPVTELGAGYPETRRNLFTIPKDKRGPWTHLRLNMFPDGGIARLRVYGSVVVDWTRVPSNQLVDLVSVEHGGQVVAFNDAHYGHPKNLLGPGRSKIMADGWETARKKTRPAVLQADPSTGLLEVPGKDWVVLKLGHLGEIHQIEVDTHHFKGNFPESCVVYGTQFFGTDESAAEELGGELDTSKWKVILPRVKLSAHKQHYFSVGEGTLNAVPQGVNYVRLEMFPDGGISRLRLLGYKKQAAGRL